jgi:predicted DNA-binding transcriptional regulator AlpA
MARPREPLVEPRAKTPPGDRVSPADRLIADLPEPYYKLTEVARMLGVSTTTMRRLIKNPMVTAPRKQMRQGSMIVYLYDDLDIEEIKQYLDSQKMPQKRARTA